MTSVLLKTNHTAASTQPKRLILLALFSIIILAVTGCDRDGSKWETSETEDTRASYAAYLQEYPEGKFVAQAKDKIEAFDWNDAISGPDEAKLQAFIKTYPKSRYLDDAREKLEAIAWQKAQEEKTIEAYQGYLTQYPEGKFAENAAGQIELLSWEKAKADHAAGSYQAFIETYPQSPHIPKAVFLKTILQGKESGEYKDLKVVSATITGWEGDKGKITIDFDDYFKTSGMMVKTMSLKPASNLIYAKGTVKKGQQINLYMAFKKSWNDRFDWQPVGFWPKK